MSEQIKKMLRLDLNIPTLLTLLGLFATIVTGWGKLESGQEKNTHAIASLKEAHASRIEELEEAEKERMSRDLNTTRLLAEMQSDLRYLRETIDRQLELRRQ